MDEETVEDWFEEVSKNVALYGYGIIMVRQNSMESVSPTDIIFVDRGKEDEIRNTY